MFNRISSTTKPVMKRFWLHLGELIASKQPHRWPELAAQCNLNQFRSFQQPEKTIFTYGGITVGETVGETQKHSENTLSNFMNSLRMVAAAYERSIQIGDHLRQENTPSLQPIVLNSDELAMLFAHPQYEQLQRQQEADGIVVGLKLSESKDNLHTFFAGELQAAP